MQKTIEKLQKIGFTHTEAVIYTNLQILKKATPAQIAKQTGLSRSTIYNNIKKLANTGVIKKTNKPQVEYEALPVAELHTFIAKRKTELTRILNQAKAEQKPLDATIYFYKKFSKEVHRKIWDEKIQSKAMTIRGFGKYDLWKKYVAEKNKNFFDAIDPIASSKKRLYLHPTQDKEQFINDKEFPQSRYIKAYANKKLIAKENSIDMQTDITIMQDWINITGPIKENFFMIIKSSALSKNITSLHKMIWKDATPIDYLAEKNIQSK